MKNKWSHTRCVLSVLLAVVVTACSSPTKSPTDTGKNPGAGDTPPTAEVTHVDGTMVVPGTDFSKYKKLLVTALDVDNIEIISPDVNKPWGIGEGDKRFFREQYTQAAVINLIADGAYATALDPGQDVLLLRSRIIRIAPPDASMAPGGNATTQVFSSAVTISMELYDSSTEKLLGTLTNTLDLGRIWDENSQASSNLQVHQAFVYWLQSLRTELDALSRRQSTLDKLLVP